MPKYIIVERILFMKKYIITGMSCAACQNRVEKAVSELEDVTSVSVSLLTNSMQVEGEAAADDIIKTVEKAGYGAYVQGSGSPEKSVEELEDKETARIKKRLITSVVLLIPLMYLSMGHMMWNWYLPKNLSDNHLGLAFIQFVLTFVILIINKKFFINGAKGFINGSPNMDTLVSLGAGASFIYSTYVFFAMTNAYTAGNPHDAMKYMHDFYFESAAMIVTLITVGKMLESRAKGKTTDAIKGLMKLAPNTAVIIKTDDTGKEIEVEIPIEQIKKDDVYLVKPGDNIPVDGLVLEGESAVDESALTGESIPVDKKAGDNVFTATLNQSGFLKCKAVRVGEDTTLSHIIEMVREASASKAPIAKVADKVSGVFVPIVIVIALITMIVWLILGENFGFALARSISVLVISCPCALGLATPVAIMVGNGVGAKNGILFKNASALELTGKTEIVALDKTGTITEGKPKVSEVLAYHISQKELLSIAYSLEMKSEHPLGKAVVLYAKKEQAELFDVYHFKAHVGNGLQGEINGETIYGGNLTYIGKKVEIPEEIKNTAFAMATEGKTPILFADSNRVLGLFSISDMVKKDSRIAIENLKRLGIEVAMLTGDNINTAKTVEIRAGVDHVIAGILPKGKENVVKQLSELGKTVMVGDGINDAPALTRADIGMAIGAGTDIAIDAADVVLMKNSLEDVAGAIRLSKAVLRNIHENLFWAFIYNIIGIPLAAGVWYPLFGITLNPMFGAAAMSLSSISVVANALRLNFVNIYRSSKEHVKKRKLNLSQIQEFKEERTMEKTMKINGMMCGHCEAAVKKALEALPEVDEALVSHEKNQAIVKLNSSIENAVLKSTVEEKDYQVESIEG